jgi:hypothetical protein
MKLEKITSTSAIEEFIAVMEFLQKMGFDASKLTVLEAADLKRNILKVVEVFNTSQGIECDS